VGRAEAEVDTSEAQKRDTNFSPLLSGGLWEKSFRVRLLFRRTLKSVS